MVPRTRLKPKEERRLLRGYLWAFRNEFAELPDLADGELVDIFSNEGRFVGRGFYQAQGGIAVRLLSRHQVQIDAEWFAQCVDEARQFREKVYPGQLVYRWVFGESDGLPGFVADRYGSVISAQTSCGFYAAWMDGLADAFLAGGGVEGVRLEVCGQPRTYGRLPRPLDVDLDGLRLAFEIDGGQKTGMFLDQRMNWLAMRPFARAARVLDGHCYVGVWSCQAALAGAAHVLGVDTSSQAVELARTNAQVNTLDRQCTFECADVAEVMRGGDRYDLIILDPPALAKSRGALAKALALYQALNRDAMKALSPGGVLITSSCSHFVELPAFLEVLKRAARAAQREAWMLDMRGAAPDHPVLLAMPETAYLKCVTLRLR
jgi:23S rRNA (cytosine1962-C5)-methyltransferase